MRHLIVIAIASLCLYAAPAPRTDAQIEQSIRDSYAKSKISADHFTVRVKSGVATIEGKTEIIQRKGWATRYAKLGGARQVVNNIQVSEAAKQRARAKLAAGRLKAASRKAAGGAPRRAVIKREAPAPAPAVAHDVKPAPSSNSLTAAAPTVKRAQIKH
jgi:hypothetical protein